MNNLLKDFKIQPTKLRGENMKIKQKALDGVNEITHDTKTGITTTTLVHTFRPCIDLFDGNEHIAHYETDIEFIEDFKRMKQELEETKEMHKTMAKYALENEVKIDLLKAQQEEFIEYLEKEIENTCNSKGMNKCSLYQEILSKYKEIVGVEDVR